MNSRTVDIVITQMIEQERKEVGTTEVELKSTEVDTAEMQQQKRIEVDRIETEHIREQQNRTEVHIMKTRSKGKRGVERKRGV